MSCLNKYFCDHLSVDDLFTTKLLGNVIHELKGGRTAGIDGFTIEHILYYHPAAVIIIGYLFDSKLISGHVPYQFIGGACQALYVR